MGVIYKLTNLKNKKIYVGQTIQFEKRMNHHRHSKQPGVDAAIRKYGWENFSVEILEECPEEMLDEREIFWIAELNSMFPNGYNLTSGGNAKRIVSEATRAKLSAIGKGRWVGEKNPFYGKHHTEEARAKNGAAHRGMRHSAETRAKMSVSHKKIFYPILDAELEKRTMTRKFLAENIGVNYQTLKRKLRGEITLDLKTAEKIRDFLGVDMTIEELFAKNENS